MERDLCFLRSDRDIRDTKPIPENSIDPKEKVFSAVQAIKDLIHEGEEDWELPIQACINQAAFSTLSAPLKVGFMTLFMEDNNAWVEDNREYTLIPVDNKEPTGLAIVRNDKGKIEEVFFFVKAKIDICKKSQQDILLGHKEIMQVVKKDAVKLNFNFSLNLDENHQPVISKAIIF